MEGGGQNSKSSACACPRGWVSPVNRTGFYAQVQVTVNGKGKGFCVCN